MALTFKLTEKTDYLLCEESGTFGDYKKSVTIFSKVLSRFRASGVPRALIDMRDTVGYPSAIERILFYEEMIDLYELYLKGGGLPMKIVFLVNSDKRGDYNPGLNVAERRDFPAFISSDQQEAIDWLTK